MRMVTSVLPRSTTACGPLRSGAAGFREFNVGVLISGTASFCLAGKPSSILSSYERFIEVLRV